MSLRCSPPLRFRSVAVLVFCIGFEALGDRAKSSKRRDSVADSSRGGRSEVSEKVAQMSVSLTPKPPGDPHQPGQRQKEHIRRRPHVEKRKAGIQGLETIFVPPPPEFADETELKAPEEDEKKAKAEGKNVEEHPVPEHSPVPAPELEDWRLHVPPRPDFAPPKTPDQAAKEGEEEDKAKTTEEKKKKKKTTKLSWFHKKNGASGSDEEEDVSKAKKNKSKPDKKDKKAKKKKSKLDTEDEKDSDLDEEEGNAEAKKKKSKPDKKDKKAKKKKSKLDTEDEKDKNVDEHPVRVHPAVPAPQLEDLLHVPPSPNFAPQKAPVEATKTNEEEGKTEAPPPVKPKPEAPPPVKPKPEAPPPPVKPKPENRPRAPGTPGKLPVATREVFEAMLARMAVANVGQKENAMGIKDSHIGTSPGEPEVPLPPQQEDEVDAGASRMGRQRPKVSPAVEPKPKPKAPVKEVEPVPAVSGDEFPEALDVSMHERLQDARRTRPRGQQGRRPPTRPKRDTGGAVADTE